MQVRLLNTTRRALLGLFLISGLSACKSVTSKFDGETLADINAFSSQTVALLGESSPSFDAYGDVRLRAVIDYDGEEEKKFRALTLEMKLARLALAEFSIRIARMPTDGTQADRVTFFAKELEALVASTDRGRELPREIRGALVEVGEQETLIEAAGAAMPVIQYVTDGLIELLAELDDALTGVVAKTDIAVDLKHAKTIERAAKIDESREELLTAIEHAWEARRGDDESMKWLQESEIVALVGGLGEGGDADDEFVERLIERFEWIDKVEAVLADKIEHYRQDHRELIEIQERIHARLNKARVRIIVWALAYARMSGGVYSPAEWFDLKQAPALLLGAGARAI